MRLYELFNRVMFILCLPCTTELTTILQQLDSFDANLNSQKRKLDSKESSLRRKLDSFDANLNSQKRKLDSFESSLRF